MAKWGDITANRKNVGGRIARGPSEELPLASNVGVASRVSCEFSDRISDHTHPLSWGQWGLIRPQRAVLSDPQDMVHLRKGDTIATLQTVDVLSAFDAKLRDDLLEVTASQMRE